MTAIPKGLRATRLGAHADAPVVFSYPIPSAASLPFDRLTPAEQAVLEWLLAGCSNDEIAARRGTRPRTVDKQIQSIYRKLGVRSRGELAARR